jgi:hypothetical protein
MGISKMQGNMGSIKRMLIKSWKISNKYAEGLPTGAGLQRPKFDRSSLLRAIWVKSKPATTSSSSTGSSLLSQKIPGPDATGPGMPFFILDIFYI